jgi:hypothetical protein
MYKKIIAREFLFFLGSLLLLGVLYFYYFFMDLNKKKKLEALEKQVIIMEHFEPYVSLQKYSEASKKLQYDWDKLEEKFPQLANYNRQALKDYCATIEERNYSLIELNSKFPEFGFSKDGSHPNFDLVAYNKIKDEINQLHSQPRYLSDDILLITAIAIFSFFFIIRYLIYATRWSIKQL